jgi:hypothetical protein
MSKLPYLVAEINAALEVYLSGRTGQQYNRTAFILCDDCAELSSKLFLLTDTPTWSDTNGGRFKNFRQVTTEVRAIFLAKRAGEHGAVDAVLKRIEARRERRNEFFHSTHLLDLNLHARDCVEAFYDLLDYGDLLFPTNPATLGLSWKVAVASTGNMETCEALIRLDHNSYSDPSLGPKVNDILSKWPRKSSGSKKKGCEVTHAEDMHLRLAIRNGGRPLRDKLRTLLG